MLLFLYIYISLFVCSYSSYLVTQSKPPKYLLFVRRWAIPSTPILTLLKVNMYLPYSIFILSCSWFQCLVIIYFFPGAGHYQGPPVMAPPQYQYAAAPPPRQNTGFLEGWYVLWLSINHCPSYSERFRIFYSGCSLAALCCCFLVDECCCDPSVICVWW